jgi:hypothetical protein
MGASKKSRSQDATERLGEELPSRVDLLCPSPSLASTSAVCHGISSVEMSSISCRLYTV